jgi:hypothetical protein
VPVDGGPNSFLWSDGGSFVDAAQDFVTLNDGGLFLDCVANVLHVSALRGHQVSNASRFGESNPSLRTSYRISDLSQSDLRAFCDWEACLRSDGYAHSCYINDAGWERCRVCDGGDDCDGRPMSQDDCVAHASDTGRSTCHVGLLQECLLQQALRGPADPRLTLTCAESAQACAGQLNGDLSSQALASQLESAQVEVQVVLEDYERIYARFPDSGIDTVIANLLAAWDGGMPTDVSDASIDSSSPQEDGGIPDVVGD